MEYLVEMTTRVPHGTSEDEVAAVQAGEAARTRELGRAGRIVRLWRPPLQPGEWRTTGLFAASGRPELEHILESMPLHVWRHDRITSLRPHPNDPGPGHAHLDQESVEFFTTFVLTIPDEAAATRVDELTAREAVRVGELASAGSLLRLWSLPHAGHSLGHWQARSAPELQHLLQSLPLAHWLNVTTDRLTRHPNDPTPTLTTTPTAAHRTKRTV